MFKIAVVLGLVAGGAGYAVYEHTDLFGGKCCPRGNQPCSLQAPEPATPSCCDKTDSADAVAPCCATASRASVIAKAPCCAEGCCAAAPASVAAKLAPSFGSPCLAVALLACDAASECASGSASATAAVAGGAAAVPATAVK